MMDTACMEAFRGQFPVLERMVAGRNVVYFDSAATTLKPISVVDSEQRFSTYFGANIHRGKHLLSEECTEAFESARQKIARFMGVSQKQTVFTANATDSINIVARGLPFERRLRVLVPTSEHHSNILPWMQHHEVVWLDHNGLEPLQIHDVERAFKAQKIDVLAVSMASNVTGVVNPVTALCQLARCHGVISCVDASQYVSHHALNIPGLGCDYLAFSAHKMFGPTGVGVLTGTHDALSALIPSSLGGGCVESVSKDGYILRDLPHRLETGTSNISGVLGLAAAVSFIEEHLTAELRSHVNLLSGMLSRVVASLPSCTAYMGTGSQILPVASIAIDSHWVSAEQIAIMLSDNYGIMVRSGSFCAHPLVRQLTDKSDLLRISLHSYNTNEELEYFNASFLKVIKALGVSRRSVNSQSVSGTRLGIDSPTPKAHIADKS